MTQLILQVLLYFLGLAIVVVFGSGVICLYESYGKWKWQKNYGKRWQTMREDTERNLWAARRRTAEHNRLLQEFLLSHGHAEAVRDIEERVQQHDYRAEYDSWGRKDEDGWKALALRSMSGPLPDGIRSVHDWDEYIQRLSTPSFRRDQE